MQQEAIVAIIMRARDEATAAFQGVKRSLGDVSQRMEGTRVSTEGGTSAFNMMRGQLLPLMGGLLTTAGALAALKTAITDVTDSTVEAEFTARALGPAYTKNLEQMQASFAPLGEQFKYTESQVTAAFRTLQRESLRSDISVKQLSETLEVARKGNLDLTAVAKAHGQEIRGNITPLRSLINEYATWETTLKAASETQADSLDFWEKLKYGVRSTFEEIVRHPKDVLKDVLLPGSQMRPSLLAKESLVQPILATPGPIGTQTESSRSLRKALRGKSTISTAPPQSGIQAILATFRRSLGIGVGGPAPSELPSTRKGEPIFTEPAAANPVSVIQAQPMPIAGNPIRATDRGMPTPPSTTVNLNIQGDLVVDTEERKARIAREIRDAVDQINRGTK